MFITTKPRRELPNRYLEFQKAPSQPAWGCPGQCSLVMTTHAIEWSLQTLGAKPGEGMGLPGLGSRLELEWQTNWPGGRGTYRGRQEQRPPWPKEQQKVLDLGANRSQQARPGPLSILAPLSSLHPTPTKGICDKTRIRAPRAEGKISTHTYCTLITLS